MKSSVLCNHWTSRLPDRPSGRFLFSETQFFSLYMGQADSSYVGQEDPIWRISSLADSNNIACPFAFVYGAWRPKADSFGGCGAAKLPHRHRQGSGGRQPPSLKVYSFHCPPCRTVCQLKSAYVTLGAQALNVCHGTMPQACQSAT